MSTPTPPPGWYPAAHANNEQRYWDGAQWIAPQAPPVPQAPAHAATAAAAPIGDAERRWKIATLASFILAGLLFILWMAALASGSSARSNTASDPSDAPAGTSVDDRAAALDQREAELAERETAVAAREEAASGWVTTVLNDGIYTIGVSAEPGVYRTEAVGEYCQWNIYLTGSGIYDTDATINFGAGEPGPIQVTLDEGQDFSSSDCGTWNRIG
jgi:hypothetical protein